jgi:hypothetical protein
MDMIHLQMHFYNRTTFLLRQNSWSNFPKCFRKAPNSAFFRLFGIKTTWYLQSHFVWLRL